jgi:hypothetical protein
MLSWAASNHTAAAERVQRRGGTTPVLIVPARTPTLLLDAEEQGLTWVDRGGGYWSVTGGKFALYVVEIDPDPARFAHREHPSRAIVNTSIGAT